MSFKPESYRILVVDDDAGMRLAMSETLKRKRYQVDQAADGAAGLTLVGQHAYQVMITDLRMPGMNGIELITQVKRLSPATEVILVTAYGTIPTAVEAMKVGAYDFIQKPFSAGDLEKIVYNAMLKETPINAHKPVNEKYQIVSRSEKMLAVLDMAKRAARSNATVLIQAESGTGKELLARYICQNSPRAGKPVIAINCAALPDNLLESELFGYEKGSFTGALHSKPGKFELADGGTILLDEIGEMPLTLQAKLLRVLQEQEVDRIGGKAPIAVDVRVIAMTNRDLRRRIQAGEFREDLYYRLNVIPLEIPKLSERPEDIEPLCQHFIKKYSDSPSIKISVPAANILRKYPWPGNVRELENVVQRALILRDNDTLEIGDLFRFNEEVLELTVRPAIPERSKLEIPKPIAEQEATSQMAPSPAAPSSIATPERVGEPAPSGGGRSAELRPGQTVSEMERRLIEITLEETGGNRTHAAKMLGISLRTLRNKLHEYNQDLGDETEEE